MIDDPQDHDDGENVSSDLNADRISHNYADTLHRFHDHSETIVEQLIDMLEQAC